MEAGKRAAAAALQPANGDSKRVRSGGSEDKTRPLSGGHEDRRDRRGGEEGVSETTRRDERRPGTVGRKDSAAVDPEEELMRALEEDIKAEGVEVERAGAVALATAEDDDYDESDDEEEGGSATRR